MDWMSIAVGFVAGAFTGAAGTYLADRFTDYRRGREASRAANQIWKDIESKFPAIIAEMRGDFTNPAHVGVRAFFLKTSNTFLGGMSEPSFEYHTDVHPEVRAAVLLLEKHGFVSDITPGNTPMYRVDESLVERLRAPAA